MLDLDYTWVANTQPSRLSLTFIRSVGNRFMPAGIHTVFPMSACVLGSDIIWTCFKLDHF